MPRWIRQLFHTKPAAPIVKAQRACLGLQRLEDRETPATFTVTNLLDDGSTGSLRWAIGQANTTSGADTVNFQAGLMGTITLGASGDLFLLDTTGATTITGPGAHLITVSGANLRRVAVVGLSVTATLSGLTLADGNATNGVGGGAILNNGNLTLQRMAFINNRSSVGIAGAVSNLNILNVDQSLFSNNTAQGVSGVDGSSTGSGGGGGGGLSVGGAIYSVSTITVTNSTFAGNQAIGGNGGKGFTNGGAFNGTGGNGGKIASNATGGLGGTPGNPGVNGNFGSGGGGGGGSESVGGNGGNGGFGAGGGGGGGRTSGGNGGTGGTGGFGSTGSNTAKGGDGLGSGAGGGAGGMGLGGAIAVFGGTTVTLRNNTITNNSTTGGTGGAGAFGGATNGQNANGAGGGIFVDNNTNLVMQNTIVSSNIANNSVDINGAIGTSGHNLIGNSAGATGTVASDLLNVNPLLGTLGFYGGLTQSIPLLAGSPAINTGSNALIGGATSDGRGAPFVRLNGTVDIGAFEVQSTPVALVVNNTGDTDDGNFGAGQLTLREAVRLSHNPGTDTITFAAGLGPVVLTTAQLTLTDTTGATTISGPSGGTQVVQRSTAGGTPNFSVFSVDSSSVTAAFNNLTISNGVTAGISNGGALTINNSAVSGNFGSGISSFGNLIVMNSTISGNTGGNFGGGISSVKLLTVMNSTISGNTAIGRGGGVYVGFGTATLTNVTITGNRSDNDNNEGDTGGGLYQVGTPLTLNNTLIAGNFRGTGNTRDDVNGTLVSTSANNLIGDGTGLTGISNGSGGNLIGTGAAPINPLLLPLANNGGVTFTHALGQNSPALGAGSKFIAGYSVYDQRGTSRDFVTPDIGAYEVNHPLAPVGVPTRLAGLYSPKPSATANEAFVKGLYQSTLLRAPDAAGLAGWLSQLAGGTSRSVVANGFVNSIENRRNQVTFFYRYFLSREPDTAGLNGWVGILQGGRDEGEVMTGFILSNEFSGLNNNSQFVNLMYYALLSRQADTAGLNGWLNALNGGMPRSTVVNAFLRSEEGINRVVDSLFQTYLKRYGSSTDLSAFRMFLNTNTFGQAAISILASAEFFTNAGNNLS